MTNREWLNGMKDRIYERCSGFLERNFNVFCAFFYVLDVLSIACTS